MVFLNTLNNWFKYIKLKGGVFKRCFKTTLLPLLKLVHSPKNSLKAAFTNKFLIGTMADEATLDGKKVRANLLLNKHFNSVTINSLLPLVSISEAGVFNFAAADRQIELALKNKFHIVGHFLICSIFFPQFFFLDDNGDDISREELIARMEHYITTVMQRYKGKINVWEVVHEAFDNDGNYVNCKFLKILGKEYIKIAFDIARHADPGCELCYSDFALSMPAKRNAVVQMIADLKQRGTKIDTIGIQGHCHLNFPVAEEFEKSIIAFAEAGCQVSITEADMSVLPVFNPRTAVSEVLNPDYWQTLNPYPNGLPDKIAEIQRKHSLELFDVILHHADKINRVTIWGISDRDSFKNIFPVIGRTDYPLLFDRKYQAKQIVTDLIKMGTNYRYDREN